MKYKMLIAGVVSFSLLFAGIAANADSGNSKSKSSYMIAAATKKVVRKKKKVKKKKTPPKPNAVKQTSPKAVTPSSAEISINGKAVTEEQKKEFERLYGHTPIPGKYWYDKKSGLYGVDGGPSVGSIAPNLDFGDVGVKASRGSSGIFMNGRELPQTEVAYLSQLLGYPIQQGRYWVDALGNAGIEGLDIPLVNLFLASRSRGGKGGDNFWSSATARGNSTDDNSSGYVYVGGDVGTVGYGPLPWSN